MSNGISTGLELVGIHSPDITALILSSAKGLTSELAAGSFRSAIFDTDGGLSALGAVRNCESSFAKEVTIAERDSKWPCYRTCEPSIRSII